jgi:hypothetical protein
MAHMIAFILIQADSDNLAIEKVKSNLDKIRKFGRLSFFDWYLIVNDWSKIAISSLEDMIKYFSVIIKGDIILQGEKTKTIDIFDDIQFDYNQGTVKLNQECIDKIIIEWIIRFNLKDCSFYEYMKERLDYEKYLIGELGGPSSETIKIWENLINENQNYILKIDDIGLIYLINMTNIEYDDLINHKDVWAILIDYKVNTRLLNL